MNDRTIILENISNQSVGLIDTQNRAYNMKPTQRVRLSKYTVQDILDVPGSKKIFDLGLVKIKNSSQGELLSMGLTEDEIINYSETEEKKSEEVKEVKQAIESEVITVEVSKSESAEVIENKELPNTSEQTTIKSPTNDNKPKVQTKSSNKSKSTSKKVNK